MAHHIHFALWRLTWTGFRREEYTIKIRDLMGWYELFDEKGYLIPFHSWAQKRYLRKAVLNMTSSFRAQLVHAEEQEAAMDMITTKVIRRRK